MTKAICIFCASSDAIGARYIDAASALGLTMGRRGHRLVFGGGSCGLMGAVARALQDAGGHVTGVLPRDLDKDGIRYEEADEIIITEGLRERKAEMERLADAFVALPGGFGTLEEIIEHVTLKQLRMHTKPVVFLNTCGFYDPLALFFDHMVGEGFARRDHLRIFHMAGSVEDALDYIEQYEATKVASKY